MTVHSSSFEDAELQKALELSREQVQQQNQPYDRCLEEAIRRSRQEAGIDGDGEVVVLDDDGPASTQVAAFASLDEQEGSDLKRALELSMAKNTGSQNQEIVDLTDSVPVFPPSAEQKCKVKLKSEVVILDGGDDDGGDGQDKEEQPKTTGASNNKERNVPDRQKIVFIGDDGGDHVNNKCGNEAWKPEEEKKRSR